MSTKTQEIRQMRAKKAFLIFSPTKATSTAIKSSTQEMMIGSLCVADPATMMVLGIVSRIAPSSPPHCLSTDRPMLRLFKPPWINCVGVNERANNSVSLASSYGALPLKT